MSRETESARAKRVDELYQQAASTLIEAHAAIAASPLVLAIRFGSRRDLDLHILEVIENFPGNDDDPPFEATFEPNERLRILGTLHLTLASPAQLRHAIGVADGRARSRGKRALTKLIEAVRAAVVDDDLVLFEAKKPAARARTAKALLRDLGR